MPARTGWQSALMQPVVILELVLLIASANSIPVLATRVLGPRYAIPLDRGLVLGDGRPLFGRSKTIRGILLSLATTTGLASLIGLGWKVGLLVASGAMAGDLVSSFIKRRMGLPSSSRATGLDQIPESLIPAVLAGWLVPVTPLDIVLVAAAFFLGELILARLTYRLGIRDRPY